jgi:hypothetical protein
LFLALIVDDALSSAPDSNLVNIVSQIFRYQIRIQQDGSFTYPALPPARYRFSALNQLKAAVVSITARGQAALPGSTTPPVPATPLPPNAYLADIRQDGVSVYDNGLVVGSHSASPLEVIVKTDGGSIEGNVIGPNREATATGLTVVLVPTESRRQNPELYKTARTDADGHFVMDVVPPGQYTLYSWENVKSGTYQNADFLRQYEDRGVVVTIAPNSRSIAEVNLIN